MGNYAIQAHNISKLYQIGAKQANYGTIQETIINTASTPFRRVSGILRGENHSAGELGQELWALNEISFNIKHGEVVGIIGRNGAGKSTLLKVLSRITKPTSGYADIQGRVGALLEVGTGFHQDLTGRENIYLNGAILGMTRNEIKNKFDEIVDFAGVERFIDTPVKRFSSGMALRLGFAVAAHLEPEILLVDEVLAVGDMEFQKKCLGKMSDVASTGRTVLFVSHNLTAVSNLCTRSLLVDQGKLVADGQTDEVLETYASWTHVIQNDPNFYPVINQEFGIGIEYCSGEVKKNPKNNTLDMEIQFGVTAKEAMRGIGITFELHTRTGIRLVRYGPWVTHFIFDVKHGITHFIARCEHIDNILTAGEYVVSLHLMFFPNLGKIVSVDGAVTFELPSKDFWGTGHSPKVDLNGPVYFPLDIQRNIHDEN